MLLQLVCGTVMPLAQHFQYDARRRQRFWAQHQRERRRRRPQDRPPVQPQPQPQQQQQEQELQLQLGQQQVAPLPQQAPEAALPRQRRTGQ